MQLLLDVSSRAPQHVRSNPKKLCQVLTNLVENALKYTEVGSVDVGLDVKREGNASNFLLILDVQDTGIGIAEEDHANSIPSFCQS